MDKSEFILNSVLIFFILILIMLFVVLPMYLFPKYKLYSQNITGQANLKQQEWEKQIAVEAAKAKRDSAALEAEAEVNRAKGAREANEIIQQSLGGSEGYLRYLYIQQLGELQQAGGQVIYVPTEAGLPILEAGKR